MNYQYIAYTPDKRLVKGKLSAANEKAATSLLSYGGYQVVNLKLVTPFLNTGKPLLMQSRVKPKEIIMFSRQLALLLESGTDIFTALELLQNQVSNRTLKGVIGNIAYDIRGGSSLSAAMGKHPRVFPGIYHRTIAAGEQGGNLDVVLRQMADYLERSFLAQKRIKSAMTYPIMLAVVGVGVAVILVTFVLPKFVDLYSALGAQLPMQTRLLISVSQWLISNGLYLLLGILAVAGLGYIYIKTPDGRYQFDSLSLSLPVIGRINLLNELSRCCRTIALLFRVGLPLPEIMTMVIHGSNNKVIIKALLETQQELIRGEGLAKPMSRRNLFLPLMVQMVGVGEETGNLDNTLTTVAQSFEVEAEDKTSAAIGLIQPIMIVILAVVVGFIAISMFSAMYSIYGQVKF